MDGCECVCALVDLWRSRGNLVELFPFFYLNVVSGGLNSGYQACMGSPLAIPSILFDEF